MVGRRRGKTSGRVAKNDPQMYMASMDVKSAFAVARPKHSANYEGEQGTHGWIAAALLRDMRLHCSACHSCWIDWCPFEADKEVAH